MGFRSFIRENAVLFAGVALPIVMMLGFFIASSLPQTLSNPPQYDLVFFVDDYSSNTAGSLPVNVKLLVRNGQLVAQYAPVTPVNGYGTWKKIYRFEAATRTVREIPFGYPADAGTLAMLREEPVPGLENVRLDTRLQAPDGYELASDEYRSDGLLGGLFWRSGNGRPRLRNGATSVPLDIAADTQAYTYNNLQFLGWVMP